ncbi:hypothetical protein Scep_024756 [Stephania cephalantha]|uniref:Uncharacterized protein n=1 Tax=Stephania cephalantha TaxID=152367 RepID=A0AAP0HYJ9_9MAGN
MAWRISSSSVGKPWHSLARRLDTPWHKRGHGQDLADSLARARSRLGTRQGLTNLDLGVDQVKVRLVSFWDVFYWS